MYLEANMVKLITPLNLKGTHFLQPGLYCTNASGSSNLVLNFIFEHVSMVSEQKTTKLILCHCTNTLVLNLTLFPQCLIQKFDTSFSGVKLLFWC